MHPENKNMALQDVPPGDEVEILAGILKHLNAEELQEARLVSREFNEVICKHPHLLWDKNQIFVNNQSTDDDINSNRIGVEMAWKELSRLDLITRFGCPCLHLYKTDLSSAGAQKFFRNSISREVKQLKLTECEGSTESLFSILGRVCPNLEHLEVVDLTNFKLERMAKTNPQSWTKLPFPTLQAVVLQSQSEGDGQRYSTLYQWVPHLPLGFFHRVLYGAPNLRAIILAGFSSETCKIFLQFLRCLPRGHVDNIQVLEMACAIEDGYQFSVERYFFIKDLKFIRLPSLQRLSIGFNRELDAASLLTRAIVEDLTLSVETFLEASSEYLEMFELINCPVSCALFAEKINSFPRLVRVDTRGSYVTELDDNEYWEYPPRPTEPTKAKATVEKPRKRKCPSLKCSVRSPLNDLLSRNIRRFEFYPLLCALLLFVFLVHMGLKFMFEKHPVVGENLEVMVFTTVVLWISRGSNIGQMWQQVWGTRDL